MKIAIIQLEELYRLIDERYNPPLVTNQTEENLFQAEIRMSYSQLVESLSAFGDEGDYYGISDFAVRPDLRDRPTVKAPPAPHVREFTITILTESFFRSGYLETSHRFLTATSNSYRIQIDQDFDPKLTFTVLLT